MGADGRTGDGAVFGGAAVARLAVAGARAAVAFARAAVAFAAVGGVAVAGAGLVPMASAVNASAVASPTGRRWRQRAE
jgi:hypothetical protein